MLGARCEPARTRVRTGERKSRTANMESPPRKLPVRSLTQPITHGPAKPPRFPIELMVAMPVAAAVPDRNIVGMAQRGGFAALISMLTNVRAATTARTELET